MIKKILLAAALVVTPGIASALQYNILPQSALPAGNAFETTPIADAFGGIGNVGFGLVQSVNVIGDEGEVQFGPVFEESGFVNDFEFLIGGVTVGETTGPIDFTFDLGFAAGDVLTGTDMEFVVTSGAGMNAGLGDPGFGIFYDLLSVSETVFLAFSDRGAAVDGDFDDLLVQTTGTVAAVPVPAALPLMLTALAGFAFLSRRRKSEV